ncbi:hypothetical protein TNIN_386271 [Trichonephila inaurata madagascariensis]|uniref:Uncharacterized protein n=1 Tax=Trichonephila inaurata madagascariensis TaxID=2747483 RepID=A0A8X7C1P4_9ARAC|nr:hypothetical protein TNIN_386271 [Trichonephila inaurata madagascariensis]
MCQAITSCTKERYSVISLKNHFCASAITVIVNENGIDVIICLLLHQLGHTAAQCNIMDSEVIAYDIQSPLVQIGDIMIAPKNTDDEL